jgi:eukaryotic-like serine/threonine-protein kinase
MSHSPNVDDVASHEHEERHPVDLLAEDFSERLRRGEHPSIEQYAGSHPEHAELIRAIFPSLALVERVSDRESDSKLSSSIPVSRPRHPAYGDFEIVRQLGMGGMGVVYKAIQRSLQRHVALKVIHESASAKPQHRLRFKREAESAASLHHTHIVPIYGIGEDHGLQYYAMQLIHGVTLQDVVEALRLRTTSSPHHPNHASNQASPRESGPSRAARASTHGLSQASESNAPRDFSVDAAGRHSRNPTTATVGTHSAQAVHSQALELDTNQCRTRSGHAAKRLLEPPSADTLSTFPSSTFPSASHRPSGPTSDAQASASTTAGSVPQATSAPPASRVPPPTSRVAAIGEPSRTGVVPPQPPVTTQAVPFAATAESSQMSTVLDEPSDSSELDWSIASLPKHYYRNIARLMAKIANALDYAHQSGVLHRDIKPANLMIDHEGTVWVTDFGLARREDMDEATQTGEVLGTLRYMAPEQLRGGGDYRTDIYSLGLTLYELLTLEVAIASPKARLLDPQRHSSLSFSSASAKSIPRDLQTIVLKACAYAPQDRYQRARDMESDLLRFLEDRPISARPVGPVEAVFLWGRRNPAVATLTASTCGLFLILASMLAIWNRQQQKSIQRISQEFNRAELNLANKTQALERVEREQRRAELNMELAMQAFDSITTNIAARGNAVHHMSGLEDDLEIASYADATLSEADVALLQSLQAFFDRFAEENSTDLRIESAIARRRVGEIQHKIGKLDDAIPSLTRSIEDFHRWRQQNPSPSDVDLSRCLQADLKARQELIIVYSKQGLAPKAIALYQDSRKLVNQFPVFRDTLEGKFELVQLISSMSSLGSRFSNDRRRKPPAFPLQRVGPVPNDPISPVQLARLKREMELNTEALQLLEELVRAKPETEAFQLSLARAHRDRVRSLRNWNDIPAADDSLSTSIQIVETLLTSQPDSTFYKYELADVLGTPIAFREIDAVRCDRALKLCVEVLDQQPKAAEIMALRASLLARSASLTTPGGGRVDAALEKLHLSIEIQRELTERYPNVPIYAMALIQTHLQTAELYIQARRPEKARQVLMEASQIAEPLQRRGVAPAFTKSVLERLRDRKAMLENRLESNKP